MEKKLLLNSTLDDFAESFAKAIVRVSDIEAATKNAKSVVQKHYVYGLQGLADLLGCSKSTAFRIKKSGVIDVAISQIGKNIIIDADLAIDLLKVRKSNSKKCNV